MVASRYSLPEGSLLSESAAASLKVGDVSSIFMRCELDFPKGKGDELFRMSPEDDMSISVVGNTANIWPSLVKVDAVGFSACLSVGGWSSVVNAIPAGLLGIH